MNFIKYWKSLKDEDLIEQSESQVAENAWNAAKEEILRIIFLNTKVNGVHKVDIEKVIEEIERL